MNALPLFSILPLDLYKQANHKDYQYIILPSYQNAFDLSEIAETAVQYKIRILN